MCNRVLQETKSKRGEERVISYLPLSHVATQLLDIYFPLAGGASVWFAQPDALKVCIILTGNPSFFYCSLKIFWGNSLFFASLLLLLLLLLSFDRVLSCKLFVKYTPQFFWAFQGNGYRDNQCMCVLIGCGRR